MKGIELFKRKCDLCGEIKLSMYHQDAPYVVYCDRCWWSDRWDAKDFTIEYDSKINFFEQWNNLLHKTPILGLSIDKTTGESSPYTNHVGNSKNCKECYDVTDCENSKFLMLIKIGKVKDSYDYVDWGENVELVYEGITIGNGASNVKFVHESGHNISDIEYSKLSTGGSHHFGCVLIKKTEYCIFNKQYTKKEYIKLKEKIIKDMKKNPYINSLGHIYRYGEFFPPEFSPNAYNDSFASKLFPLSEEEVIKHGLKWYKPEKKEYIITKKFEDLPDHIKDVPDTIKEEVIDCSACKRGFRIINQELQFLRNHNLPLPRQCPFCRIWSKVDNFVFNMKLFDRICDKCDVSFKTHYSKERALKIFCKKCY